MELEVQAPDVSPAELEIPRGQPSADSRQPVTGPLPSEAPGTSGGEPASKRRKTTTGHETRRTASEPARDSVGPIPSRPSIMNHHHIAEKFLSAACPPAIREEMRRTNSRVLYREGQSALLRVVNTFNHALAHIAGGEQRVDRLRREAVESRDRATRAEDALKFAQAGEAERFEIVRSRARAETEAAQQQMRQMLERALAAEGKLMAAEAELVEVKTQLEATKSELKSSEEKTEIAEEVARMADIRVAEATEALRAADKKSVEAAEAVKAADKKSAEAEAAVKAAEGKATEAALKAVEDYRNSPIFVEEVAEAGSDAYLQGFYCCRAKAVRVSGVRSLEELEPEEGDLEEEVRGDPASTDDPVPPSNAVPATQ